MKIRLKIGSILFHETWYWFDSKFVSFIVKSKHAEPFLHEKSITEEKFEISSKIEFDIIEGKGSIKLIKF